MRDIDSDAQVPRNNQHNRSCDIIPFQIEWQSTKDFTNVTNTAWLCCFFEVWLMARSSLGDAIFLSCSKKKVKLQNYHNRIHTWPHRQNLNQIRRVNPDTSFEWSSTKPHQNPTNPTPTSGSQGKERCMLHNLRDTNKIYMVTKNIAASLIFAINSYI